MSFHLGSQSWSDSGVPVPTMHNTKVTKREWCSSYPVQHWGYRQTVILFLPCTILRLQADNSVLVPTMHNAEATGRQWCSCSDPAQSWGCRQTVVLFLPCTMQRWQADSGVPVPTCTMLRLHRQTVVFLFLPCTILRLQTDSTVIKFVTWLLESKHKTSSWHCKHYYQPVISLAPIYKFLKCWVDIILDDTYLYC